MQSRDVVVIGAGPYGLSAAAHLRGAGIDTAIFGDVMAFWREMPQGMLLRSAWDGSHISDPDRAWSLHNYDEATGWTLPDQLDMTQFTDYGRWFQRNAVPDVDPRFVRHVARDRSEYRLMLSDGSWTRAARVVVATGLTGMASMPEPYNRLPMEKVSHASQERGLARHQGKRVAVIGSGQSALETSALLNDGGAASIEVITRSQNIHWLGGAGKISRDSSKIGKLIYPPGAVGPLGINWIVQMPGVYKALPAPLGTRVFKRALRPAGSGWIKPRVNGVVFTTGVSASSAQVRGDSVLLSLTDGSTREVDHVLLGTGYKVVVEKYSFLANELKEELAEIQGQPKLRGGFESSVPGLYFLGAPADLSFGPLMRFVAGSGYAASHLAGHVRRSLPRRYAMPVAGAGMAGTTSSAD